MTSERTASLEAARILGRYKRLVLLGRARLPLDAARRLVGPDCAYHLYFRSQRTPAENPPATTAGAARRRRRRKAR
jgi:hypothetical protein